TTANDGNWRTVDVGERAGCGISTGRFLYCWGYNPDGQLGVGDYENRSEPTRVTGRNWAQVSMGTSHTCGIKTDGIGYCWGANPYGQLGIGSTLVSPNTPRMIDEFDLLGRPIEDPMTWSS